MIYQNLVRCFSVTLLSLLMLNVTFAQNAAHGKELFLANCASCHSVDMKKDLTGPHLGGVEERWADFPREELYAWIRNSQGLIANNAAEAQPYASALYQKWGSVMTPFPALKDADMEDLLLFIKNKYEQGCAEPPCETVVDNSNDESEVDSASGGGTNSAVLWILALILVLGTIVLARYINNLNRLAAQKTGAEPVAEKSFLEIVLNPTVVRILVFALVILGGYTTVNNAIGLGRQQDYAPAQPIKFSHALHAGENGIDCQYCHDGARRSKHAVIPGMNTCMNCHTAINAGPEYGTAEILKIYASTGFNPISNKTPEHGPYFEESVDAETRTEVYKKWLEEANKDVENVGEGEIKKQLAAAKPFFGKTVEWIRIHNLPDHAYFNHSQHVSVGKVACQDCHGAVEEMALVKQHAPLSMGWCINCHRQTNVKFAENEYYTQYKKTDSDEINEVEPGRFVDGNGDKVDRDGFLLDDKDNKIYDSSTYKMYEQYHNELTDGDRKGVTVEDIGGLECQKCHY